MWGHSPALDLLNEYTRIKSLPQEGELRILLVGSIDARHILQTMAHWKRHETDLKLVFYILDMALELVARQMMFLTIALEPRDRLGLHEKARLWMEVYGNTLVRPTTARYLIDKASQLVRMVTDRDYLQRRMPCMDLDSLRYMEKDHLENIFKYWMYNRYSLAKIWDKQIRKELGTRYDAKMGVFDWDYNMKLLEIDDGKRVCLPEYRNWRSTGVGFTWLETEQSVTNPTLACGIGLHGDQLFSHGYVGDTTSGPFFAFGTQSEEKKLLETTNGYNHRRATDITERNLQRLFVELETGSPPTDLYSADIDMGLVITSPPTINLEDFTALNYEPDKSPEEYTAIPTKHKVVFLPVNALDTYPVKSRYHDFFDMAYVAEKYFKFLSKDLIAMVKPHSPLIIETRKFVIAYDKKIGEFEREVKDKMKDLGGKEISKCHYRRHSYALYKIKLVGGNEEEEGSCEVVEESELASLKASTSGEETEDDIDLIESNEDEGETLMEDKKFQSLNEFGIECGSAIQTDFKGTSTELQSNQRLIEDVSKVAPIAELDSEKLNQRNSNKMEIYGDELYSQNQIQFELLGSAKDNTIPTQLDLKERTKEEPDSQYLMQFDVLETTTEQSHYQN